MAPVPAAHHLVRAVHLPAEVRAAHKVPVPEAHLLARAVHLLAVVQVVQVARVPAVLPGWRNPPPKLASIASA